MPPLLLPLACPFDAGTENCHGITQFNLINLTTPTHTHLTYHATTTPLLQPAHLMLALKTAMASAFKSKNYINAASFARRLLELPDMNSERNADSRSKAQKVGKSV